MRVATSETGAAWNEFFADLVARGLDTSREQDHGVDDPSTFTDLHRQRIGGHEGERAGGV